MRKILHILLFALLGCNEASKVSESIDAEAKTKIYPPFGDIPPLDGDSIGTIYDWGYYEDKNIKCTYKCLDKDCFKKRLVSLCNLPASLYSNARWKDYAGD